MHYRRISRGVAVSAVLALLVAAAIPVAAGGATESDGSLLAELREQGQITVGIANEIPYGYEDAETGEVTGEAPEIAREVLSRLGIEEMDAVVVEFGALIPGLQAGQFDMIAAGMFITPPRAEQIIFSDPDYCAATAFAVAQGNPHGIDDFASVASSGIRLAVMSGAVEEGYALSLGVPEANLVRFGSPPDAFDALAAGRADAVALTDVTIAANVANMDGFESTAGFIPVIDGEEQLGCGGFGFLDQELRDAFNAELKSMQANGEIYPIVRQFGFSQTAVDKARQLSVTDLAN